MNFQENFAHQDNMNLQENFPHHDNMNLQESFGRIGGAAGSCLTPPTLPGEPQSKHLLDLKVLDQRIIMYL